MNLEVGMYVRTKKGIITKIELNKNDLLNPCNLFSTKETGLIGDIQEWYEEECTKASYKIRDLIEVGDFITYKQSNMHWSIPTRVSGRYNRQQELSELVVGDIPLKNVEITSIVTKEQFEREAYKI